jgi:heme exporter protein B
MLSAVRCLLERDLTLAFRRRQDALTAVIFFIIVVTLFPLGIGPELGTLRAIAPGVVWVAALLASLLPLERLFASDYQDGTLEQLLLVPYPLPVLVLTKTAAHWLVAGLPLVLVSPLLGMQMGLEGAELVTLGLALLIGTPVLSLIGAIGAALTLGLRGGGILMSLLILPLYVPVLILGAGAVDASLHGMSPNAHLSLLGALFALALPLAPWATAAALRITLE